MAALKAAARVFLSVVLVAAAFIVLGPPQLTAAIAFARGAAPSMSDALAVCQLLCWGIMLLMGGGILLAALRTHRWRVLRRSNRAALLVLLGAAVLLFGALRHVMGDVSCCPAAGSLREVLSLVR